MSIPSEHINSIGLIFDIAGAFFVAYEVLNNYKGKKHIEKPKDKVTWNDMMSSPQETDSYIEWQQKKNRNVKAGLFCFFFGFGLQIVSNYI